MHTWNYQSGIADQFLFAYKKILQDLLVSTVVKIFFIANLSLNFSGIFQAWLWK